MKRQTLLACSAFAVLLVAEAADARPGYDAAVPNASLSCGTCHVAEGGGGARNAFGQDVEATMPFSGPDTATWEKLFCVDSDGDGKTNGQELGDPCGGFASGDADPDFDATRPGDDADTTAVDGDCDGEAPPTCDLAAGGGGCAAMAPSGGAVSVVALVLALARRRRRA
jgi:hypothetical protein